MSGVNEAGEASQVPTWPIDKLNALRAGQRLVAEVPATAPGRRAFVSITPATTPADDQARQEGWKRADHARTFRLQHWDYDADRIDGYDYDIGAVMVKNAVGRLPASVYDRSS